MGVMTIAEAWPATGRPFTVADLDRMPDDGRRYELVQGVLIVSPRPSLIHQAVALRLAVCLDQACPRELQVVPEPAVMISADTELDADIVVVRKDQLGQAKVTEPPVLAAEVQSPSTALIDLSVKKAAYERFGIRSYWIAVPDPAEPELIAFESREGRYVQVAHVSSKQAFRPDQPFSVEVVPSHLVDGLRP